jgi:hypothetical protein
MKYDTQYEKLTEDFSIFRIISQSRNIELKFYKSDGRDITNGSSKDKIQRSPQHAAYMGNGVCRLYDRA